ncbi:hypothetical protein [Streptomyces sp. NPDC095613]|uniref:hypothetical protein n=1 Tax=Streptomyces sp. NPDC095613 TaxID=3155540 RepID=UPI0033232C8A
MNLAPLPDHARTDDPLWQTLFHRYRHVIAPLRRNGWTTDIEMSGREYHIRADLGDGTELIIATSGSLPVDPDDVDGWVASRQTVETPKVCTALYDSTPNGPQAHHGIGLIPMMMRIDKLDARVDAQRLLVLSTTVHPSGASRNRTGPIETPGTAVARAFEWSQNLVSNGHTKVWERPEPADVLAVFERDGLVTAVRVGHPWRD